MSAILGLFAACDNSKRTFSVLADSQTFEQNVDHSDPRLDVLWVIDGSATMLQHQQNLANNFGSFMSGFVNKGFDYHMAVISTDAWVRENNYGVTICSVAGGAEVTYKSSADCYPTRAKFKDLTYFRDGDIYGASGTPTTPGTPGIRSGIFMLTSLMQPQDVIDTFAINAKTGTRGDGTRESGFASIRAALRRNADGTVGYSGETHTELANFRRDGVFLAVIIISDEEDQSRKTNGSSYTNTADYVNNFQIFLDGYTNSVEGNRKYNVSSMVLTDLTSCSYTLDPQATVSTRYIEIANATDGVYGNICSPNFSSQLEQISKKIVTLSTRFQLDREPIQESIRVVVNGVNIIEDTINGWTYVEDNGFYFIEFHGTAVPAAGATIAINFDPTSLQ